MSPPPVAPPPAAPPPAARPSAPQAGSPQPAAAQPAAPQAGSPQSAAPAEAARFIAGLYERELHEMVVREGTAFLQAHGGHAEADLVRYHLAASLFELGRQDEARPHFAQLAELEGFQFAAEVALRLGQCELAAGRAEQAAAALQRCLALDADYLRAPATFLLGEAEFARGRFAEAARHYGDVVAAEPDGAHATDARAGLAWCALRLGALDEAQRRVALVLQRQPDEPLRSEMQFVLGEVLLAAERPGDAQAAFAEVRGGPFADAARRGTGLALGARGDHAGAAAAFAELLQRFPESRFVPEATLRLGIHRLHAGDARAAWEALSSPRLPDDAETCYWRARARAELGDADGALALLDRAAASGPGEDLAPHVHRARGDLLAAAGRPAEAAEAYARAGTVDAWHAAAVKALNAGDASEALRLLDPLVARAEADASMLLTHGEALFAQQRYADAAASFARAAQASDAAVAARAASRRAWCLHLTGEAAAAADAFAAVAREHGGAPEAAEALFMHGVCLDAQGRGEQAVAPWTRYLEQHPRGEHRADVLLRLAELTDGAAAQRHLRALLAEDADGPHAARAGFALAESLAAAGDDAAAIAAYRDVLARFADHELAPAARYGLAWCLSGAGDHAGAVAALAPLVAAGAGGAGDAGDAGDASRRARGANDDPRAANGATADRALLAAAHELLVFCHRELRQGEQAERSWKALLACGAPVDVLAGTAATVAAAWKDGGDPARALAFLDAALATDALAAQPAATAPLRADATWLLLDAGATEQAAARLAPALRDAPTDARVTEAAFFVGEAFFEAGDDARAVPLYAAAARTADATLAADALYKQGFASLRAGELRAAAACFERLVESHPDSALWGESAFLAGEAAHRAGDHEACARWMERLLAEQPGHEVAAKARFRLGLSLARLERWEQAERVLAELARRHPDFEALLEAELWRGEALAARGEARGARAAYERVVAGDRGVLAARAQLGIGRLQLGRGEVQDALSSFLKVAVLYAHENEVAEALLLAGGCLEQLGDAERARDRYAELLRKFPDSPFAHPARQRLEPR